MKYLVAFVILSVAIGVTIARSVPISNVDWKQFKETSVFPRIIVNNAIKTWNREKGTTSSLSKIDQVEETSEEKVKQWKITFTVNTCKKTTLRLEKRDKITKDIKQNPCVSEQLQAIYSRGPSGKKLEVEKIESEKVSTTTTSTPTTTDDPKEDVQSTTVASSSKTTKDEKMTKDIKTLDIKPEEI